MIGTLLLVLLIVLLILALPAWSFSRHWGYWPSTILSALLIAVLVLNLSGQL